MTVLFKNDWNSFPTAIADFKTRNRSFVRMASIFKQTGVENHLFLLALIDRELVGVDPHDPTLSTLIKGKITQECKINPWYYLREVARVPGMSGDKVRLITANRSIISMWWLFFNHVTNFVIHPRQTGKSFGIDQLTNYLMEIRCKSTEINLLTKDDTLRTKTIARIKAINITLPYYLRHQTRDDARNHREFTVKALKNYFTAHLPSNNPKRADAIGRGFSSGINMGDEGPFSPNSDITTPSMMKAASAAREAAKRAGEPYGNIFTTTAGFRNTKEGKFFYKHLTNSAEWTERYYDANDWTDLEQMIRSNSRVDDTGRGKLQVNSTFSYQQLGKTEEWMMDAIENSLGDRADIAADLFNEWIDASTKSPLNKSVLQTIIASKREPLYTQISPQGYILKWYIPEADIPKRTKNGFIMALDTSEGIGGDSDDCGMVFRDIYTGEIIAAGIYNTMNITTFTMWLFSLFVTYPKMLSIIERKSTGVGIIDQLCLMMHEAKMNPFARLFNMVVNEQNGIHKSKFEKVERAYKSHNYDNDLPTLYKKYIGFSTSKGTGTTGRTALYGETLMEATKNTGHLVYDTILANQITGLRTKNGRIDHGEDDHDDLALAWCLSYFILHRAANIDYYGINPLEALMRLPDKPGQKQLSPAEVDSQRRQHRIITEIDRLKKGYSKTKQLGTRNRIESRLRFLAAKVEHADGTTYNIDQILQDIKDSRQIAIRRAPTVTFGKPKRFFSKLNA